MILPFTRRSLRAAFSAFPLAAALTAVLLSALAPSSRAQAAPSERTFHESKSVVENALKQLQPAMSGRLPALEGFALAGDHPLNRYQRAYYQSVVQVTSTASSESVVRVSTKVTAWYADSIPSHSGYQLLTSNGRLESDLLDQLADLLASSPNAQNSGKNLNQAFSADSPVPSPSAASAATPSSSKTSSAKASSGNNNPADSAISAPMPQSPEKTPENSSAAGSAFPPLIDQGLSPQHLADAKNSQESRTQASLQAEAASLEEVLKNQAHPKNLVAIKKSGTPVVASPSLTAKTLFMASAHDEFEMLDFNADWVHVRISGLSRGWIWRTGLEMPEGISEVPLTHANASPAVADLFQVTREETAPFPGDWEPLRGRNVRIISVQKIQENQENTGPQAKLEYAKSLLDKDYSDLDARSKDLFGVVFIFDSIDGGMMAATLPTVRQWKAGALSDAGLWHQCYFDPPETFTVPSPPGGH